MSDLGGKGVDAAVIGLACAALFAWTATNLRAGLRGGRVRYGHIGRRQLYADRSTHPRGHAAAILLHIFCLIAFAVGAGRWLWTLF